MTLPTDQEDPTCAPSYVSMNLITHTGLSSKISFIAIWFPLILRANCISLGCMVIRLACIASRLASSSKLTMYASAPSWRHSKADLCHLKGHATYIPFLYSLLVIVGGVIRFECSLLSSRYVISFMSLDNNK